MESSWTLCRLSSTLCWLEEFHGTLHDVVHASIRRTLCYPLYRHWKLALTVLQDTRDLFRLGQLLILQDKEHGSTIDYTITVHSEKVVGVVSCGSRETSVLVIRSEAAVVMYTRVHSNIEHM